MISVTENQAIQRAGFDTVPHRPTLRSLVVHMSEFLKKNGIKSHHLDAQLIVTHTLGLDPIDVYRKPDLPIDARYESVLLSLIHRRASGVPTAYIIGTKEFWSLSLAVDERVLIPRPETEILVEESLSAARLLPEDMTILELCTGSGAVSIALGVELVHARIVSTDISRQALSVAEANASVHGLRDRIVFRRGDLFEAINPGDRFDIIVCNPPYLTDEEMSVLPPEIRAEPKEALHGGNDGLSIIERMVHAAPDYLEVGGFLIFEIGALQGSAARHLTENTRGLLFSRTRADYAGHPRVVIAQHINQ